MRIGINIGGEPTGRPTAPLDVAAEALAAEESGVPSAWMTHFSRGIDSLTTLAAAAARTSTIDLGVGVIPTYPRHPLALAQQAATVQSLSGGRLTLGVGVSHRPVIEGLHGLAYDSPAAHMADYLSVLVPLLRTGAVTHRGEYYAVDGGFTVPDTAPVDVLVGALGPRMCEVAGRLADGVITWLAGPRSIGEVVVPSAVREAASSPRIVAAVPVAIGDEGEAREVAATTFARYAGLENYQRLFDREGGASVADLALAGDADAVADQIRRFRDAGATEMWLVPFPVRPDGSDLAGTVSAVADLARDLADL